MKGLSPERRDGSGTEQSLLRMVCGQGRAFIAFGLNFNMLSSQTALFGCVSYASALEKTCECGDECGGMGGEGPVYIVAKRQAFASRDIVELNYSRNIVP